MNRTTRKPRPEKRASDTCPKCGYCDKCGRSNATPFWSVLPYMPPYMPYVPPINTWPYRPYWQPNSTTPITTIAVGNTTTQPSYNPSVYNLGGINFSADGSMTAN